MKHACAWGRACDKRGPGRGLRGVETHPNTAFKKPCTVSNTRFKEATTSISLRGTRSNALRQCALWTLTSSITPACDLAFGLGLQYGQRTVHNACESKLEQLSDDSLTTVSQDETVHDLENDHDSDDSD